MNYRKLSETERQAALVAHPGWREENGRWKREWEFRNFNEAFGFMSRVALLAEKINHHPDWSNSYRRVHIELVTHDAPGGPALTNRDLAMVEGISRILAES